MKNVWKKVWERNEMKRALYPDTRGACDFKNNKTEMCSCPRIYILYIDFVKFSLSPSKSRHYQGAIVTSSRRLSGKNPSAKIFLGNPEDMADQKQTPWPLVYKRTIPTERPPLVDEI
jgi:hypothetical protein